MRTVLKWANKAKDEEAFAATLDLFIYYIVYFIILLKVTNINILCLESTAFALVQTAIN